MKIKVILVDDHVMIREGIKQLLEFDQKIEVVAQANDGVECLELLQNMDADILLLDINMPRKNGLDTLSEIRRSKKKIKVLMLTVHEEVEYLVKATDIGVDGYILKEFNSFKTNIVSKVKEKVDCSEDIILHNKKIISPKKFIDDNIDEILDTIYKELFSKISDPVTKGFNALFDTTFDDARKKYIKTKKLNDEAYKKIVLYTWPDFEFLIYED